jgi:hypothetical protein
MFRKKKPRTTPVSYWVNMREVRNSREKSGRTGKNDPRDEPSITHSRLLSFFLRENTLALRKF